MRTYEQLKAVIGRKKYVWFEGELNLNCIWERTSDNFTDTFDDFFYIAYQEQGQSKVICIDKATTNSGNAGALDPLTVDGITGVAVIKPGQYRGAWEFFWGDKLVKQTDEIEKITKKKRSYPFTHPYFEQIGPVDYYRDGNKDLHIDKINEQDGKKFATRWHAMTAPDTYGTGKIGPWSLGCMGWPEPEMKKFLSVIIDSIPKWGDKFTGTLLETTDFLI